MKLEMKSGWHFGLSIVSIATLMAQGHFLFSPGMFLSDCVLYPLAAVAVTFAVWSVLGKLAFKTPVSPRSGIVSFVFTLTMALASFAWAAFHHAICPFFYVLCFEFSSDLWLVSWKRFFAGAQTKKRP